MRPCACNGKAADQGHDADAQYNLGIMYAQGKSVKLDFREAARLYRKAADQGNANAQCSLGFMYAQRQGVKQDFSEALRWFRKASEQGHEQAKNSVLLAEEELRRQHQAAPASQPSSSHTCANCCVAEAVGGGALKPCSRCKAVVYCGTECQMQHWKKAGGHKAVCK